MGTSALRIEKIIHTHVLETGSSNRNGAYFDTPRFSGCAEANKVIL